MTISACGATSAAGSGAGSRLARPPRPAAAAAAARLLLADLEGLAQLAQAALLVVVEAGVGLERDEQRRAPQQPRLVDDDQLRELLRSASAPAARSPRRAASGSAARLAQLALGAVADHPGQHARPASSRLLRIGSSSACREGQRATRSAARRIVSSASGRAGRPQLQQVVRLERQRPCAAIRRRSLGRRRRGGTARRGGWWTRDLRHARCRCWPSRSGGVLLPDDGRFCRVITMFLRTSPLLPERAAPAGRSRVNAEAAGVADRQHDLAARFESSATRPAASTRLSTVAPSRAPRPSSLACACSVSTRPSLADGGRERGRRGRRGRSAATAGAASRRRRRLRLARWCRHPAVSASATRSPTTATRNSVAERERRPAQRRRGLRLALRREPRRASRTNSATVRSASRPR